MIVLFTSKNIASGNIAKKLIERHGFVSTQNKKQWERESVLLIDTEAPAVIEVPTDFETDCLIVLSTHRSKTPGKMLTAHVPGNWGKAEMGGEPRTLNVAHASMLKALIIALKCEADKISWPVSIEADHHGPTCSVPIIFVEIGNNEEQWGDEQAGEAVADAVAGVLFGEKIAPAQTVCGFGGGHYSKRFTTLMIESGYAVGHIAPKYAIDDMGIDMFRQAVEKNVEKASKALILKDETNLAQKEKIKRFAEESGIEVEMI